MNKNIGFKRTICCAVAMVLVICTVMSSFGVAALDLSFGTGKEVNNEGEFVYLSDYLSNTAVTITKETGWGNIMPDQTPEQKPITMRIEGQALEFKKGIWAHATSTLVFDLSNIPDRDKYTQFSAFVGLNTTANGNSSVRFTISTSANNKDWDDKYTHDVIGTANGEQVIFELGEGTKYLKLYAWDMGGNGSDHAIYGDAMLLTDDYENPMKGPKLKAVDAYIRDLAAKNDDIEHNDSLKLAILQRDFIGSFGEYTLAKYVYEHPDNREFIEKVLLKNQHNLLDLYVFGDPPNGTYSASMDVFAKLYNTYKTDLEDEKNGKLYARMIVALSKTHSTQIRFLTSDVGYENGEQKQLDQYDPKSPNVSDPVKRYAAFKKLHSEGRLHEMFDYLPVPLLRLSMQSKLGDDEYDWLNNYFRSRNSWFHESWIRYSFDHSFTKEKYHDPEQARQYQATYGFPDEILNRTNLTTRYPSQWMVFADAGTCGIISPSGVNCWNSIGVPAFQIHQPAHTAICAGPNWSSASKKITSWTRQNSLAPFSNSAFQVYPPLGWGRGTYAYGRNLSYIFLSQYAINDWDNYKEAEYYIKLANSYDDDSRGTRIELYKKALGKQNFNFDAFLKLIEEYKANDDRDNLLQLGKDIIKIYGWDGEESKTAQQIFTLPMYDLVRLILPGLKDDIEKYVTLSEERVAAFNLIINHDSDNTALVQALRGDGNSTDNVASFSFDGVNKKKIILGNMFDPADAPIWGYHFTAKNGEVISGDVPKGDMETTLSDKDFYQLYVAATSSDSLTGLQLYVDFKDENGTTKFSSPINIINSNEIPARVVANDYEDKINGVTDETRWYWRDPAHPEIEYTTETAAEYLRLHNAGTVQFWHKDPNCRFNGGTRNCGGLNCVTFRDTSTDLWKTFGEEVPDTSGEKTYTIRKAATGCTVYSGSRTIEFTKDVSSDSDRYYSLEGTTIVDYSSETAAHPVTDAFDGNLLGWKVAPDVNSYTDTHWTTGGNDTERYVTVKFDSPIWLTRVEYTAAIQDFGVECPGAYANGTMESGVIYGSMDGLKWTPLYEFNGLKYDNESHADQTKKLVIPENNRKLVQYVKIQATKTYTRVSYLSHPQTTLDENGVFSARGFTFFHDAEQNSELTGVIQYNIEGPTNQNVTAQLVNLSTRGAEITGDGLDRVTFTQNGSHTFTFTDKSTGKSGSATATVDWIDKEAPKAHVEYSTKEPTTGEVVAQLKIDEKPGEKETIEMKIYGEWVPLTDIDADLELDPTDKKRKYAVSPYEATMDENGTMDFELRDKAGNYATYQADVRWIYNEPPEVEVVYSTKNPTNGRVIATLRGVSTEIFPVGDEPLTYEFTENGDHVFHYRDAAGNEGSILAVVDWIDRTTPTAHVEYDITKQTKGPVTATLVVDSAEPVTVLGGGETHTFTRNGVYLFRFRDTAGNVAEVTANVTWIAPGSGSGSSGGKPAKPTKPAKPGKP